MGGLSQRSASPRAVLVIVCAAVVLASLDLFIVNVALPQMARDFGDRSLGSLSWVLNAYAIVYAALLVVFGRLADRHRRDRAFLLGVTVFVAASAACGAADGVAMLIAFRAVQAAGAALLTPTSLGLILASAEPERRVNVPVGIAALIAGRRWLPRVPGEGVGAPDLLGASLITAAVGAITLGLVNGGSWGWDSAATLAALAGGALALGGFALHNAHARQPLIERALLEVRAFTGACAVALWFSAAFGAMLLSRVLWSQDVWHWSALLTGLTIAPGPIMVPLFAFLVAGRLIARFGPGPVIAAGCAVFAAGSLWWALDVGLAPDYAGEMLGGILLTGIGVGLTLPTLIATGAASLPPQAFATGSGVVNMVRQLGLAVGVAIFLAVLGAPGSPLAALDAYRRAWLVIAGLSAAGGLISVFALGSRRPRAAPARPAEALAER